MRNAVFTCFIVFFFNHLSAQIKDTLGLGEVIIFSNRTPTLYSETSRIVNIITQAELKTAAVKSLEGILEVALNVDVRERGTDGTQSDISIRGGSFEQTLILLNGSKFNDPQTGHHNLDIPINIDDIERIEVLEGPGSRIYGPNAFSGAINIITRKKGEDNLRMAVSRGQHNYLSESISISKSLAGTNNFFSVSQKSSDGYSYNTDYKITSLFYQLSIPTKIGDFGAQAGYLAKNFGANSFYSPKYINQYEETRTKYAAISYKKLGFVDILANTYFRRHHDKFELYREGTDFYHKAGTRWINYLTKDTAGSFYKGHNYHKTDVAGADLNLTKKTAFGSFAIGAEYKYEHIYSNVLGELLSEPRAVLNETGAFFTKSKDRQNTSLFVEYIYLGEKWAFSGGALANMNSQYNGNSYAGVDASYKISSKIKVLATINQSLRLPTFTDLYYVGPDNVGNLNLKPEKAVNFEIGYKFFSQFIDIQFTIFYRRGENMIAWTRADVSQKWMPENFTTLNTRGAELSARFQFQQMLGSNSPIKFAKLQYTYIEQDKGSGGMVSNYLIDNLKHKFTAMADFKIYKSLGFSVAYNLQERAGSYTPYDLQTKQYEASTEYPLFGLVDLNLYYDRKQVQFFANTSNLFDVKYRDFGDLIMPGRWIKAGIKVNLNL